MSSTGKRSFVSIIVGILILSTVLKNVKVTRTLAIGLVAALVTAGMAGGAGAVPYAYIPNSESNTVSVIDTATNTVTATVNNVGSYPVGVAVNPAGTKVYVANEYTYTVSVIDTATNTITATVNVGAHPHSLGQFIGPTLPPTTGTTIGSISVTTNLAGATFSLTGASSYSGSGTS